VRALALLVLAACASKPGPAPSPAPVASASADAPPAVPDAPASASAAPTAAPVPSGPPPTGGSVMVGDINAPKNFDPKPTVVGLKPKLLDCYNQARATNPSLHGKITLRIAVNESGITNGVDADQTSPAYDANLVSCIDTMMKASAHFPKPGGMATVAAPLVFRP
jgi:hypothetical protein